MNMTKRYTYALVVMLFGGMLHSIQAQALEFGAISNVKVISTDAPGESSAFAIGALDLFATHKVNENTVAFIEYVFEGDESFVLDLERLWIKRTFSDAFELAGGRFHSSLGYWNRTYHHGAIIQPTVSRPFFLDFEDGDAGILPAHTIGFIANGQLNDNFSYEASIANSSFIDSTIVGVDKVELGIGNASDRSDDKSIGLHVTYDSSSLPMTVGVFIMQNSIVENATTGTTPAFGSLSKGGELVDQIISGIDFRYQHGDFDVLAEYYNLDNDATSVGGKDDSASAYFFQFGYQATEQLKVIYRNEALDFEATDIYFQLLGTQEAEHNVIALRYDIDDANALTLEINSTDFETAGNDDFTITTLDWSFLLF